MGKRSDFIRKPRDYYQTPLAAVKPLIPHLPANFTFCEPCAGDGRLITHLEQLTDCVCSAAYDIEPQTSDIDELDATELTEYDLADADLIITNPPWIRTKQSGYLLHTMIERFSDLRPTWLLFDADWIHTVQASELIRTRLCKIVSIGRVKWIEDSSSTGKDNCAWYLFDVNKQGETEFHGR
jgi:hypothetical protein